MSGRKGGLNKRVANWHPPDPHLGCSNRNMTISAPSPATAGTLGSSQKSVWRAVSETLLLIDPDRYTADLLAETLRGMGYVALNKVHNACNASAALDTQRFQAVILNFQSDQPDMLVCCATARLSDPDLPVIVITVPGPGLAEVKQWQNHTCSIDAIIEKPLRHKQLEQILGALVSARQARSRSDRLAQLMPAEAAHAADSSESALMIEQVVLFTDLRRSTNLAVALGPLLLFERVNAALSAQAQVVRKCGGTVIKFTGDGLMATFRGSGKNHLALRCALALQPLSGTPSALPFGIGLAAGLTITGFIGEPEQRHYDVIGATVHLAARLCALAGPGEIVTTAQTNRHSGISQNRLKNMGLIEVRGFDAPIDCVSFAPPQQPNFDSRNS